MSSLESEVQRLLKPMFWGKQVELPLADQTLVARWATKTAVVAQSIEPPPDRRPVIQADWLRTGSGPAPYTLVALGAYSGPAHLMALQVQAYRSRDERISPATCAGELVILWIEHLVIVTYLWDGTSTMRVEIPPQLAHSLIQIWPASTLIRAWPPTNKLSDTDRATLHHIPPLMIHQRSEV
jgi:hypothetical protein